MEKAINIQVPDDKVLKMDILPNGEVELEIDGSPEFIGGEHLRWRCRIPENRRELVANFIKPDAH